MPKLNLSGRISINSQATLPCPSCGYPTLCMPRGHFVTDYMVPDPKITAHNAPQPTNAARDVAVLYECSVCHTPILFRSVQGRNSNATRPLGECELWPPATRTADHRIEEPMRSVLDEAHRCCAIGAWNATGVMCRRLVEEEVNAASCTGNTLYKQIEDLREKKDVSKRLIAAAQSLRVFGKEGAHADVPLDLTRDDAEAAIEFAEMLMDEIYVRTAKIAEVQEKHGT